jgi:hypothetical protein
LGKSLSLHFSKIAFLDTAFFLGWIFFSISMLTILSHSLLAYKVSTEKFAASCIITSTKFHFLVIILILLNYLSILF